MIVCDDNKKIIYYSVGHPGSRHDSSVFGSTALHDKPGQFFSDGEYLIGDSAYSLSTRMLVPFKGRRAILGDNALFNEKFSRARVAVEHVMSILKNRFQSLKGLRMPLRRPEDVKTITRWIVCTMVVHNFCRRMRDDWETEDTEITSLTTRADGTEPRGISPSAEMFRDFKKSELAIHFHHELN
jgi:hypothetical protein